MLPVLACTGYASNAPLLVEFAPGSTLLRETDRASHLPIHRNGPPGTFIRLGTLRISLPTDQIVSIDETGGTLTVGFGGMSLTGIEEGRLTFARVRDLLPEEQLSPDRSWTMTLETKWVEAVYENGRRVWPGF